MAILLSRSQILSAKLPTRTIEVPEWDGMVRVQAMDLNTRDQFLQLLAKVEADERAYKADPTNVLPPMIRSGDEPILGIIFSVVDEDGNRIFEIEDANAIRKLGSATVSAIYVEFLALNQFGSRGDAVETEKKDSETTLSDVSPSA